MLRRLVRAVPIALALLAAPAIADEPQKDPANPAARPEQHTAKGAPGAKAKPVAKDAAAAKGSAKASAAPRAGGAKATEAKPAGDAPAGAPKPPPCVEMKPCSID